MVGLIAGIIVTVLFMGFSIYRTVIGIMPIVDWLMDLPKYWHGLRTVLTDSRLP